MDKRKIEKIDDLYMILKPLKDLDEGWEKHGKRYDCRGLSTLLKTTTNIEFILFDDIKKDLEQYEIIKEGKRRSYLMK